mmetsp:Transcript_16621/g.48188  ORF Transcript_16621/g.48188 Transcript_16621/m.48188 type:complete len:395 (+) Transcript_16621:84-1268(+)
MTGVAWFARLSATTVAALVVSGAPPNGAGPPLGACAAGDATCAAAGGTQGENMMLQISPSVIAHLGGADVGTSPGEDDEERDEPDEAEVPADDPSGEPCRGGSMSRRRRYGSMCSCRRRHSTMASNPSEERDSKWVCKGNRMVARPRDEPVEVAPSPAPMPAEGETSPTPSPAEDVESPAPAPVGDEGEGSCTACLCMFDIDRTLTGKQGKTRQCPRNTPTEFYDEAYGGGKATLSALAGEGISKTFCNGCLLGITSAGSGSGERSSWNRYILDHIMRGEVHDAFVASHPDAQRWSFGTKVQSPYVIKQPDKKKQYAVELVRRWYGQAGVCIKPENVYFFGDRTENMMPFKEMGMNSREISCGSRDRRIGNGMVGYCGGRPEEIQRMQGNFLCE